MSTTGQFLAGAGGGASQTNFLPGWYEDYLQRTAAAGLGQASQGYTPYGGQRLAQTSNPTLMGRQRLVDRGTNPVHRGALTQAQTALTSAASPVTGGAIQRFMNPYQDQVVDNMVRRSTRAFEENTLPQLYSGFTGAGQTGSAREMEYRNRAIRDFNTELQGNVGNLMASGFDTATGNAFREQQGMLGAGGALSQLATTQQNLDTQDISSLLAAGQDIEGREQQGLDLGYGDFQRQQGWNWDQLNRLNSLVRGMQMPTSSVSSSSTVPQRSGTLQLLGGALGMAREIGQMGQQP